MKKCKMKPKKLKKPSAAVENDHSESENNSCVVCEQGS